MRDKPAKAWTKILLTTGAGTLAVLVVVGNLTPRLLAQSSATPQWQAAAGGKMAFDVASVKPNKTNEPPTSTFPLGPGDAFVSTGGLFRAISFSLIDYLRFAFKLGQGDLLGLSNWVSTDRFDIEARSQGNPTKDQMRLMMQSHLADRFKLKVHYDIRQGPVYALVLVKSGKTGPQLQPGNSNCSTAQVPSASRPTTPSVPFSVAAMQCGIGPIPPTAPSRLRIGGRNVNMGAIAGFLKNPYTGVDRPVIDRTGLKGAFDFTVEWTDTAGAASDPNSPPDAAGATFLEALQEQLGLKLVPQTGPVDVLVIDHVEEPSEN